MNVCILGFDKSFASSITGLMDIFHQAKQLLATHDRSYVTEEVTINLVSVDGKPILCQNNVLLNVHGSVEDVRQADILIVTSIHDLDKTLIKQRFLVDWLRSLYQEGTALAGICTGAFLLAETGLLDGLDATTHWSMFDLFSKRYPRVRLNSEKLVINHGDIYCSGGNSSAADLAYYLIEKHFNHSLAARIAKFFVHDFRRVSQRTYVIYEARTEHNDSNILKTQRWINDHLAGPITIRKLSEIACMSQRTFERRFKMATGDSPNIYVQRLRVEAAKQRLETTNQSFDEISYELGYKNSGSFRKIFFKWVNLLPLEYRERFRSYND